MDEFISYIEEHLNLEGYIFLNQIVWIVLILHLKAMHYEIKNSSMSDSRLGKGKAVLLKKVVD